MRDSINIGCTPSGEQCEQVGTPEYDSAKARFECNVFIRQLRRIFGDEPDGARLYVKSNPHDFGSYLEVECYFDDDNQASMDYAFRCEGEMPEWWDQAALDELNAKYPGKYKLTIDD
jgi:hypothetical protein